MILKNAVGSVADHAKRAVTGTSAGLVTLALRLRIMRVGA